MRARRTGFASIAAVLTVGAIALLALAVASAPAGNRAPGTDLEAFPGPTEINYGENIGYTAKLANTESSTFTHIIYHHRVPTTDIGGDPREAATLVYSSCEPGRSSWPTFTAGETYDCPELSQLAAHSTATVLTVWRAPGKPTEGDNLTCGAINDCVLESFGWWTIKEGTGNAGSAGPDTFPNPMDSQKIFTPLLGAATDLTKARGYVLDTCSTGSSLETSKTVKVGPDNKLFSRICATSTPNDSSSPLTPGLIVQIDELDQGGITETVFVCIPAPPSSVPVNTGKCPATPGGTSYIPWSFADNPQTPVDERARFDFTIDNTTLPKGEKIDSVSHNGADATQDCTIKIDNKLKVTNVSCKADKNGDWRFG